MVLVGASLCSLLEHPCTKAKFPFQLSLSSVSCLPSPVSNLSPVSCLPVSFHPMENSCDTNLVDVKRTNSRRQSRLSEYYRPDLLVQLIRGSVPVPCTTATTLAKPMCKQGNDGDSQEIKLSGSATPPSLAHIPDLTPQQLPYNRL